MRLLTMLKITGDYTVGSNLLRVNNKLLFDWSY